MNPILYIRTQILGFRQAEFARLVGVSQGTVSKWESGELEPDRNKLSLIRDEVIAREKPWDDRWFFEAPAEPAA